MKIAALIAVAGLASMAAAQTVTVNLTHDDADGVILIGDTVNWTLSVAFTGFAAGSTASGGNMALNGNAVGTSSAMTYTPTNGGNNDGTSNGAGIGFISWTNSLFLDAFGSAADKSNPFTVGTFTFTGTALGSLNYVLSTGGAASAFLSIDEGAFSSTNFAETAVAINIDALTVAAVPTPASAALLGLGGLVATRRRR